MKEEKTGKLRKSIKWVLILHGSCSNANGVYVICQLIRQHVTCSMFMLRNFTSFVIAVADLNTECAKIKQFILYFVVFSLSTGANRIWLFCTYYNNWWHFEKTIRGILQSNGAQFLGKIELNKKFYMGTCFATRASVRTGCTDCTLCRTSFGVCLVVFDANPCQHPSYTPLSSFDILFLCYEYPVQLAKS